MTAQNGLTQELRAEVLRLEDDLRARVTRLPDVNRKWRAEYDGARAAERTAAAWEPWVDERVTLAAVAWVLTTVFIRFCEDNNLVRPVWITGPRSREALDRQQAFLRDTARTNPDVTDREWLLEAVKHLKSLRATAGLVDDASPMWLVTPSGDAVTRLLDFWRERDDAGNLLRDLADPDLDTRFLGDLYQNISEDARTRYALLQTPIFVEEFILDRTLEPALNERPLEGFKMIDPTCGSGHFLLGGFARLLDRWHKHAPAMNERDRVQKALDSVYGVDINPFAVAIARFRLTVAALVASAMTNLEGAPAFDYHLATADSLLVGVDAQGGSLDELDFGPEYGDQTATVFAYSTEDYQTAKTILRNGQYDTVVGNPPYITVADRALNAGYRSRYATCRGQYALTAPFMQRFFTLAREGTAPGWVGQITSNSFMKREFGTTLVEDFLPTKNLVLILDTSGAYIPGHGTPTVIIIGTNRRPTSSSVRVVLSIHGEPGTPDVASRGLVWTSVVGRWNQPGWTDNWISVADLDRDRLRSHPWVMGAGETEALIRALSASGDLLESRVCRGIGRAVRIGSDDAFVRSRTAEVPSAVRPLLRPYLAGEDVRDYGAMPSSLVLYPYVQGRATDQGLTTYLWPYRTVLAERVTFQGNMAAGGREWWEYMQHTQSAYETPLSITFANVASHNHFALDRGGHIFNAHAPVIKLPEDLSEDRYLELVGVLNSSVACFWLRQNSYPKGGDPVGDEGARVSQQPWSDRYEFTGTTLKDFPLPTDLPTERSRVLDELAQTLSDATPAALTTQGTPTATVLESVRNAHEHISRRMIAEQEELDWDVYRRYGLIGDDLTSPEPPEIVLGERAFEIALARRVATGAEQTAWFERHRSTPITEIPADWPAVYRDVVQRRLDEIERNPYIRLLERPEYKRRWAVEPWEKQQETALRGWILDRLETREFWLDGQGRPTPMSLAALTDKVSRDSDLVSVIALWEGRPDVPLLDSLTRLMTPEAVPHLAAYRYRESGLRKRAVWEETWRLQRLEDAGQKVTIAVPPKYTTADFARTDYWSHRGKLDVPKERFISYPDAGREGDPTLVVGWAGWDHGQQALALASLIQSGEQQGWGDDRLTPLVAGLAEVLPWVQQWYAEHDPLYGGSSPADFFAGFLDMAMTKLGATRDSLQAWRPAVASRGRRATR